MLIECLLKGLEMKNIVKLAVKDVLDNYPTLHYNKQSLKEIVIGLFQQPVSVTKVNQAIEEVLNERKA